MKQPPLTRKEYLDNNCSHNQYYKQFVTPEIINYVGSTIGRERIAKSLCQNFNDVPLELWDSLTVKHFVDKKLWSLAGNGVNSDSRYVEEYTGKFSWSKSDNVCIAKAAARVIRSELGESKCREITVEYRPLKDCSGLRSLDTSINGNIEDILDYYLGGFFIKLLNGEEVRCKVIGVEFHN